MAKAKKFDLEASARVPDDADRVRAEKARELLPQRTPASPSIKELLLDVGPRFEDIVPKRGLNMGRMVPRLW